MLRDEILAVETRLLLPEVRASAALLDELVSADFLEFGASGRTYDKARIVALLVAEPTLSATATIGQFRVVELAPEVALATYRLGTRLRSSIWRRELGAWKILFHQGTPSFDEENTVTRGHAELTATDLDLIEAHSEQGLGVHTRADVAKLVQEVRRLMSLVGGSAHKRRYILDGQAFATLEEFAAHFSAVVLRDHTWNGNLDAFNDVLRGGFGTPAEGFVLHWRDHAVSRLKLGYAEMERRLERLPHTCDPSNASGVELELSAARAAEGPTLFELLVEIIRAHGAGGDEAEDGVELILA